MTRTKQITLTALIALAWLVTLAGLAVCWMLMPLGVILWLGGMALTGYACFDIVCEIWGLNDGCGLEVE